MRSEQAMYDRILGFANSREDIRAVILNGSRANPNRKADPFNDFDIVYLVEDVAPYKDLPLNKMYGEALFGDMLVYERTDESTFFNCHFPDFVCYLMQFADGNRIDLTVANMKDYERYCFGDGLAVILLDKDNALPPLPPQNESAYYVAAPTQEHFFECRTEFWWVAPYVTKGLWRGQLLYAWEHIGTIRKMLLQMLKWYAGALHGFEFSAGKKGDRLAELLPAELRTAFLETFPRCEEADIRRALFACCTLFTKVSHLVAEHFGFSTDDEYDRRVTAFLRYTLDLPSDAKTLNFTID